MRSSKIGVPPPSVVLVVGILVTGSASGQDTGEVGSSDGGTCGEPDTPSVGEPGGWGPVWRQDPSGGLLATVTVHPRDEGDLWVRTTTFLSGGRTVTSEAGPFSGALGPFDVAVPLAAEIGTEAAYLWVNVTAVDPSSGQITGHRGTRAAAFREASGAVRVLTEAQAVLRTSEVGVEEDGLVEEGLVGRVVVP